MSLDLSSNCRTCLSASDFYHQLFDYVDDNYKILDMLDGVVPQIDVKNSSYLSTAVCVACVDKLLTGYKFQQLCIETNKRLHKLLAIGVSASEPKQEPILDPLIMDRAILKMKEEIEEEEACFEKEMPVGDLKVSGTLDNEYYCSIDSSNEILSVKKQKSSKKSSLKVEISEKPLKIAQHKGNFPCPECGKEFTSINRLKQHRAIHIKNQAFPCGICNTTFTAGKILKSHMLTHKNNEVQIKSDNDPEKGDSIGSSNDKSKNVFENQKSKANDEREAKGLGILRCPDCPKCFVKKTSLAEHSKIHKKLVKLKKCQKLEPHELNESDELNSSISLKEELHEEQQKINRDIVKEEIEITPQIFEEELVGDAECFENDYEESEDNSEEELFAKTVAKEIINTDFVDTGIGEIEKPNSNNKRSRNFPCDMCGKVFDRPSSLKRHTSVHSLTRPHECHICKYRFSTTKILKAHLFQHENKTGGFFNSKSCPEGFKCPDCPRRFEKQASLSAHHQIHTRNAAEQNYPCMVCKRNFMSVKSLTEHVTNKHPEVEKHKCNQCDKTFVLHAHLTEHLNRHKGNRNLVCLICEKEFGYPNILKEHMRTHTGESPYLCPECGKTYRSESNLRQHMKRHMGLKNYQCPECPSRFNCRSDLMKHASTHSNAKPHVCDICGSRFTRSYSLQKHKRLHSGEKPFKCDQCSMTFAIIDHLRRHMRTHTGEKPYKCNYCDRAYAENGDLNKHLRTHVGENTYMCNQCPLAFKYQVELRQHQSQHYKMAQKLLQQSQKTPEKTEQQEDINELSQQQHSVQV